VIEQKMISAHFDANFWWLLVLPIGI